MLKASALYIVIIMALVIAVICSAVIVSAYYHRTVYAQNFRYQQLENNLQSGINLMLVSPQGAYQQTEKVSLFETENDSVILKKNNWGLFDACVVRSFIQHDTLDKAFLMANTIDSTRWCALYVIDEDRSISVSGATHLQGNVFIPKAGIKTAYVNNQAYTGDSRIVDGIKKTSDRALPELVLKKLDELSKNHPSFNQPLMNDSLSVSFLNPTRKFYYTHQTLILDKQRLKGNIMIVSDSTVTIDSTAKLDQVIILARSIKINSGFNGRCQLFATDSLYAGKNASFSYPSALGIVPDSDRNAGIKKLTLEDQVTVAGTVFIGDKGEKNVPPVLSLGKNDHIMGQIYVPGLLNLKDHVQINGSVFTNRFLYQSAYTRYENYLINLDIDISKLSSDYLSSDLLPATTKRRKVLEWLR